MIVHGLQGGEETQLKVKFVHASQVSPLDDAMPQDRKVPLLRVAGGTRRCRQHLFLYQIWMCVTG